MSIQKERLNYLKQRLETELKQTKAPNEAYDDDFDEAVKLSLMEAESHDRPDNLLREQGMPVAIRNKNNICFFNSILQTVYPIKPFHYTIMEFEAPEDVQAILAGKDVTNEIEIKRKKGCVRLVCALQKLFGFMTHGIKSEVDPTELINCFVNSKGDPVEFGEEQDIGEFLIQFLERLEEGLEITTKKSLYFEEFRNLFFGESNETLKFKLDGYDVTKVQKHDKREKFCSISLSLEKGKDFNSSLEAFFQSDTEGYQAPLGQKVAAKKITSISKLPKGLAIHVQRVFFDPEKGTLVKHKIPFEIAKEFYVDQYLDANREIVKKLFKEQQPKKELIRNLANTVKTLERSQQSLMQAENELNSLIEQDRSGKILSYESDSSIELETEQKKQFVNTQNTRYTSLKQDLERIYAKLCLTKEEQVHAYQQKSQEEAMFQIEINKVPPTLQKIAYHIHSVVIHEGRADTGHYYTLVYNRNKHRWTKFNDSKVDFLPEEEGFRLAKGEDDGENDKNACAYWAFYVKKDCEILDFKEECIQNLETLTSKTLLNSIEEDKEKFFRDYTYYQDGTVDKIRDQYLKAMDSLVEQKLEFEQEMDSSDDLTVPNIPSFDVFLLLIPQEYKQIGYWNVLNSVVSDYNIPYEILNGENENFYSRELERLLQDRKSKYKLDSLNLSSQRGRSFDKIKQEYATLNRTLYVMEEIFESILAKKWKKALIKIETLMDQLSEIELYKYREKCLFFTENLLRNLLKKADKQIKRYLSKASVEKAIQYAEIIGYCLNKADSLLRGRSYKKLRQEIISHLYDCVECWENSEATESLQLYLQTISQIDQGENLARSANVDTIKNKILNKLALHEIAENIDIQKIEDVQQMFQKCLKLLEKPKEKKARKEAENQSPNSNSTMNISGQKSRKRC